MKVLRGDELALFVKQRQAKQVRGLRQADRTNPRLAIITCGRTPVIDTYTRVKQRYGKDILVEVDVYDETITSAPERIASLNADTNVHGIIVQLPISDPQQTDYLLQLIDPAKDVDGLGATPRFTPATPMAIEWLLVGYGVDIKQPIALVGAGRLVGGPLAMLWRQQGLDVTVFDESNAHELAARLPQFPIVVSATGVPGLITSQMLASGAVFVDAGTASEDGVIKGDGAADVRERSDLTITPVRGGVGPLTVAALFDNVITAARQSAEARRRVVTL